MVNAPAMLLHLRSDVGVIMSGANVNEWQDQSGGQRHFTSNVNLAGKPTTGLGAVRFTASAMYNSTTASVMQLASSKLNIVGPYTLFVVAICGPSHSCFISKSGNATKRRKLQMSFSESTVYALEGNGDIHRSYNTGSTSTTQKRLFVSQFSSDTVGLIRYNGSAVTSTHTGSLNYSLNVTNTMPVFLGASPFSPGIGYNAEASTDMYLYEIRLYGRALTTSEMSGIEAELNSKYTIY